MNKWIMKQMLITAWLITIGLPISTIVHAKTPDVITNIEHQTGLLLTCYLIQIFTPQIVIM